MPASHGAAAAPPSATLRDPPTAYADPASADTAATSFAASIGFAR